VVLIEADRSPLDSLFSKALIVVSEHPKSSHRRTVSFRSLCGIQLAFAGAFAASWFVLSPVQKNEVVARTMHRAYPLDVNLQIPAIANVAPLYDDAEVVSDEELAMVLHKIIPRFSRSHLRPNLIEHAIRTWGTRIEFQNPDAISGPFMASFLTDSAKHMESWGTNSEPLMIETETGVYVRWAEDSSASVHHDHTLAALTEAGLPLDFPVFTGNRSLQVRDVLAEALRDFQLDERETEWSAMSFALWLAPKDESVWHNGEGRQITFDMLVERLMRNHKRDGVCLGTHRVYSLMLMLRLNEQQQGKLMTPESVAKATSYLGQVRDLISVSQWPDGSWNSNWADGAAFQEKTASDEKISKRVIATGHQLEWLSIAPKELHPPREQILKAADWLIKNVQETPQAEIDQNYTFYSHVGKALAMWRKTSPEQFWTEWRKTHPDCEQFATTSSDSSGNHASPGDVH